MANHTITVINKSGGVGNGGRSGSPSNGGSSPSSIVFKTLNKTSFQEQIEKKSGFRFYRKTIRKKMVDLKDFIDDEIDEFENALNGRLKDLNDDLDDIDYDDNNDYE